MSLDSVASSCLKYVCKIAQCASFGEVLISLEATYVNENGEYEKNILLLTSEVFYFFYYLMLFLLFIFRGSVLSNKRLYFFIIFISEQLIFFLINYI